MLAAASVAATRRFGEMPREQLDATRYLVDAAAAAAMPPAAPPSAEDIVGAEGRIAWLVDLCMRLEQEEHEAALADIAPRRPRCSRPRRNRG